MLIFLNFFGLPRSSPLAGGLVLALMTLPTIIISSRVAIKSVPPSIREAAMGLGASKMQSVLHHVVPLAVPGILTGTIIGMARASELLFTAKLIDSKTAKEWGLISDFYKSDDLLKEANEIASSIIKQPPDALRMSKKLLREGMGASFDNILEMSASMQALMHLTDDHQEALSAFFEKRDGDFKGK